MFSVSQRNGKHGDKIQVFCLKSACVDVSVDKRPDTTRNCPVQLSVGSHIVRIMNVIHLH